ncbi:hypothetical protein caldi_13720 [Caldinitratiruptor microaerophilus]|uniref:Uncharacterized protein n=1 Tax=Caldinitratiruptor microaerophilus TaxID=671077 RepID=A0AA35CMH2_9FIRM|nr:hypothetical protein caldi_13720 [Caldinitratiruptor microaerophilus]
MLTVWAWFAAAGFGVASGVGLALWIGYEVYRRRYLRGPRGLL